MRTRKRVTQRQKTALLERYEADMQRGRNREEILEEVAEEIGVTSQRQVERILAQAKEYQSEIKDHQQELSITTLTLASNLESYLNALGSTGDFTGKIGDVVYGGCLDVIDDALLSVEMYKVDKRIASNLLLHIKLEFPELTEIKDWAELPDDKITRNFVESLRLKANHGDFMGKCPACPGSYARLLARMIRRDTL